MTWVRVVIGLALVALVGWWAGKPGVETSTFPMEPIKVVIPFSQGGESDTFARILQKGIEDNDLMPVPLVIINRNGASGTLGSRHVKNAKPDGYTILMLHDALFMAKLAGQADFGPEAFDPIAATGRAGLLLAVSAESRFKNLKQLMDELVKHPNTIVFGANIGAPVHFAALQLENTQPGAEFRFTQSGSGSERFGQLKGGQVDVTVFAVGEFVRFRKEGDTDVLRALAYFGDERHPGIPDVPTAVEQGFPLEMSNMQFWWCPRGTPRKRVQYLAGVLKKALATDYVRQALARVHSDPVFLEGDELRKRIDKRMSDLERVELRPSAPLPDIPNGLLAIVCVFGLLVGLQMVRSPAQRPLPLGGNRRLLAGCLALTVAYVVALSIDWLSFPAATVGFVLFFALLLARGKRLSWTGWLVQVALALFMGIGLYYLFTQVFVVDLP